MKIKIENDNIILENIENLLYVKDGLEIRISKTPYKKIEYKVETLQSILTLVVLVPSKLEKVSFPLYVEVEEDLIKQLNERDF